MQILRVLTLLAAAVTASQRATAPETVAVRAVIDGDTLDVAVYGRIGLAGIKAPRLGRHGQADEPFARPAQQRLEGIVGHRFVRVEFPSAASRSTAYVLLDDGTFVNAMLVGEGLARVTARGRGARAEELRRAEERARRERAGLWGAHVNSTTPNAQVTSNAQRPKLARNQAELEKSKRSSRTAKRIEFLAWEFALLHCEF
jgi:endonuclease YncB( thermonuclease family)